MGRLFIMSTGLLLLLGLIQFTKCADINGSSIVKDETPSDALTSADQEKLSVFFPDEKSRFFKLFNGAGDKRNPSIYSFGLGKRSSRTNPLNPYSFGLGKRTAGGSHPPNPYSFGLGKRTPGIYSFGLGKRGNERDEEMLKRDSNRFGFGLGKRNSMDDDSEQWLVDEEYQQQPEDDEEDEEEEMEESREMVDFNKRSRAFFPSHSRASFYGSGQLPNSITMNRRPVDVPKTHNLHQQPSSTSDLALATIDGKKI